MKRSTKYKEVNVCLLERKVLRNISKDGVARNKNVWSMIKPFLTKGCGRGSNVQYGGVKNGFSCGACMKISDQKNKVKIVK